MKRVTLKNFDRAANGHNLTPTQIYMLAEYLENLYGLGLRHLDDLTVGEWEQYIKEAEENDAFSQI